MADERGSNAASSRAVAGVDYERVQFAFREAQQGWKNALEAHRMAPPDVGFSSRLAGLAEAARAEARVCRDAEAAGFEWPPHRAAGSGPPYELRPGTGRRGPGELWQAFDGAVAELNRASTGSDLLAVAEAYDDLADAAARLAEAIERDDRENGLLPKGRVRRSA